MPYTLSEATELFMNSLGDIRGSLSEEEFKQFVIDTLTPVVNNYPIPEYIYNPSTELIEKIELYCNVGNTLNHVEAGRLMEEIALLAFKSIKGWDSIKSFHYRTENLFYTMMWGTRLKNGSKVDGRSTFTAYNEPNVG